VQRRGIRRAAPAQRDYNDKFGFPFILAVKGPTGRGLTRQAIIATFTRRLKHRAP
jgi:N-carbamoyl-L-amino-acid hydrolase